MHVIVNEESVEVRLALWQKILGLLGNIVLAREQIAGVSLVEDPLYEAMDAGLKVGLRLPWLYYVARTIRLDQAFVVRRGVPGISIAVRDHGALTRVLLSTPDARELSERLRA